MTEIEKKEIEEIASIVDDALRSKYQWTDEKALEVADELVHKLGYRKVEDYKKEIERIKEENIKLEKAYSDRFSKEELDQRISFAQQQAIKEFAQHLIENQSCHNVMCQTVCYISEDDVKIALKEFCIGE